MSSDSVVYHKLSEIHTYKKDAKKEPPGAAWRQAYCHPRRLAPVQFLCGVGRHVALRGSVHRRRSVAPPFSPLTKAPTGSVASAAEPVGVCMLSVVGATPAGRCAGLSVHFLSRVLHTCSHRAPGESSSGSRRRRCDLCDRIPRQSSGAACDKCMYYPPALSLRSHLLYP